MQKVQIIKYLLLTLFIGLLTPNLVTAWSESDLPYHISNIAGNIANGELNSPAIVWEEKLKKLHLKKQSPD